MKMEKKSLKGIENKVKKVEGKEEVKEKGNIYEVEEVELEEMAIDGICGVY